MALMRSCHFSVNIISVPKLCKLHEDFLNITFHYSKLYRAGCLHVFTIALFFKSEDLFAECSGHFTEMTCFSHDHTIRQVYQAVFGYLTASCDAKNSLT